MLELESQLSPSSATFAQSRTFMREQLARVNDALARARATELAFTERARKAKKLLPRERLGLLLDRGAPFLEIAPLAGYGMYGDTDGSFAGGQLIAGIGFVSGRRCLVIVWNHAIKGGTITRVTTQKMLRLQEIAKKQRLPIVSLSESGGGNLEGGGGPDPWGAYAFIEGGLCYCQQAELSALGIPQIVVAHGNATAGGAYHVALSDYVVLVRGQTQLFLAGPPLLKAATGEVASAEALGGAEMHARVSGTGEYLANDDADGIRIAREIVAQLPRPQEPARDREPEAPRCDPEELDGLVSADSKAFYDMREVIARIVDGSRFLELGREIDAGTLCGHAHLGGHRVGLIANNAPITPHGAKKAAELLQLCDHSGTPVIFLHNTTGFLVGVEAEERGQVKHGAKLIQAVANARVPKLSLVVGKSYGAGNYAMASRALKPDFIFAWPTARTAVMGGAQAAKVLQIVAEQKLARSGVALDENVQKMLDDKAKAVEHGLEVTSEAMYCSARLFDDGILDPRDSRKALLFALETCLQAEAAPRYPNTFGVARF
ncbi:MAG TPA: carboxyl transferase domain-containing protein [Polyangiales bacterium]|jgi:geranyl-CoA carboxylase beta subunit|nr:carboxyl transferase domain-containing protein [Polyangiales bacterium]